MSVTKRKKIKVTNKNFGDLLLTSAEEALDHARGRVTLKTETLDLPAEPPKFSKSRIKKIREQILDVSQPIFATILACSPSAVKSWERGENSPSGSTRRLLQIIENDPTHFLESISNS
ncbi:hypothetical protein A9Q84_15445 [Halobacteriovorax marinus]|uniref:HTH cro/C1-type domain-containing protein n=1 Tax=Halobacteriovorax marinus TaxID=97084 RepID=A0A1Y5F4B0_9BACT|nr:hypothetical protein A9Q84_15445 [Halobacteriovorax marinus]